MPLSYNVKVILISFLYPILLITAALISFFVFRDFLAPKIVIILGSTYGFYFLPRWIENNPPEDPRKFETWSRYKKIRGFYIKYWWIFSILLAIIVMLFFFRN